MADVKEVAAVSAEGETDESALAIPAEPLSLEEMLSLSKEHCEKGDLSEAVSVAEGALVLAREGDDKTQQSMALCTLAEAQRRSGNAAVALETAKEMRTLCHSAKMCDGEAQALVEIAQAHLAEHETKPAARAAAAAAKLCQRKGATAEVALQSFFALADASLQLLGDYAGAVVVDSRLQKEMDSLAARAYEITNQAVKMADEFEDMGLLADALYWNARSLIVFSGKSEDALEAAGRAKMLYHQMQHKRQEGECLLVLAQAYHKIEERSKWAVNAAHDALEVFQDLKDEAGKDRTLRLFQELGIALRVAGGAAPAGAVAAPAAGAADPAAAAAAESQVAEVSKGLDAEEVLAAVREMATAAIGLEDELFADSPLMDSGMDSLTAVSFRNGLQQNLGVKLPSSLMFDYPTMKEVASRIVELSLEDE